MAAPASTAIAELEAAAERVGAAAGPSVVRIGRHGGRGCGVVVAPDRVLTNAHNLRDRTTQVTFADGRAVQGELAGVDGDGDLAVLAVPTEGAPAIQWADAVPGPGAIAFALSRGRDGGTRLSFGMVSGVERAFRGPRGRRVTGGLEHTAPLARGSSGSPLLDAEGRLVALNTARLGEGFYLALPADAELRERVEALTRGESPQRLVLGVGLAPAHVAARLRASVGLPDRPGLLVRAVEEASAAARAGIQVGDLLTAADGRDLTTVDDLHAALDAAVSARRLALHVVRGADELDVEVAFDDGNEPAAPA